MNFNLVDVSDYLRERDIFSTVITYGEFKGKYYFYTFADEMKFYILSYDKKSFLVQIEYEFDLEWDKDFVELLELNDNDIIYCHYDDEGNYILKTYNRQGKTCKQKGLGCVNNISKLDENYYILECFDEEFIYDLGEDRKYKLEDKIFKDTYFSNTRKIKMNEDYYLVHNKHMFDIENIDYYLEYSSFDDGENGLYLLKYDEFLEDLKARKSLNKTVIDENKDNFLILALKENVNEYYFAKLYRDKTVKILKLENCEEKLVGNIDLSEYDSFENISYSLKPLRIYKTIDEDRSRKLKVLYPEEDRVRTMIKNNDNLSKITEDAYFFEGYENGYYYLRVYDRYFDELLKIKGKCEILNDNKTILVYDRKNYQKKDMNLIVQDGNTLIEIFHFLRGLDFEYSLLIEDISILVEGQLKHIEKLPIEFANMDRLWEFLSFDIVSAKFGAYSIYRDLEEIIEESKEENQIDIFEIDLEPYDSSRFRIDFIKGKRLNISTNEEKLLKKLTRKFKDLVE